MKEHKYFSIGNASAFANPDDGLCVFAGDAPKRTGEYTTSHSLRAPFVLISSIVSDRRDMAEILEEVLNQNAHRFFSSAANAQGQIEEEPSGDDEVSAADRTASLTQKIASLQASLALCERRAEDAEARNVFLETEIVALAEKAKR